MHEYAVFVPRGDVLEVGDVIDGGTEAVLFLCRTAEDEVC